jgi:hypothetical protein
MRVEFIDEKGNTYKTLHPPTNEVVIEMTGYRWFDVTMPGLKTEIIPDRHKVRVAETVGQQPVEG